MQRGLHSVDVRERDRAEDHIVGFHPVHGLEARERADEATVRQRDGLGLAGGAAGHEDHRGLVVRNRTRHRGPRRRIGARDSGRRAGDQVTGTGLVHGRAGLRVGRQGVERYDTGAQAQDRVMDDGQRGAVHHTYRGGRSGAQSLATQRIGRLLDPRGQLREGHRLTGRDVDDGGLAAAGGGVSEHVFGQHAGVHAGTSPSRAFAGSRGSALVK